MDGITFLNEVRQDESLKSSLIYILTNSEDEKHKTEAFNLNVAGYILKSSHYPDFVQTIKSLKAYWELIELPENLLPQAH